MMVENVTLFYNENCAECLEARKSPLLRAR